jgi:sugar/nucleoside kinase (ribokinase family)
VKNIAILSHVVIDEIHRPGQTGSVEQIGGAGAYAAVGASLVSEPGRALIVSGVGRVDRPMITDWAVSRGIDPAGLFDVDERSPRTRIEYYEDGDRVETPVYGLEHFEAHTPLPRHIPQSADLAGAYLFHAHEKSYWDQVAELPQPILWEISRDSCHPSHLARVRELAATVDVLSINVAEAKALLGDASLADLAPIVLLRKGERGSVVINGSRCPPYRSPWWIRPAAATATRAPSSPCTQRQEIQLQLGTRQPRLPPLLSRRPALRK